MHPLRCKAIVSARLKNKVDAAIVVQLLRADLLRRRGSPRRRCGSSARHCGTRPGWSGWAPACATGSSRLPLLGAAALDVQARGLIPSEGHQSEQTDATNTYMLVSTAYQRLPDCISSSARARTRHSGKVARHGRKRRKY